MKSSLSILNQLAQVTVFLFVFATLNIFGATFTVTNTNDSGTGSLRQAILDANAAAGADTIVFDASFNVPRTITMASAEMLIDSVGGNLTINGPGMNLLTVSGNDQFRVFQINSVAAAVSVEMNNFTIVKGALTSAGQGAGSSIALNSTGTIPTNNTANLTLNNIAITNVTQGANAYNIYCRDNCGLTINNSYIGNNSKAVINFTDSLGDASIVINNSTIENNVSGADGLIVTIGYNVTVTNTTISDNVVGNNGIFRITLDTNDTLNLTNTTIVRNRGGLGSAVGLSGSGTSSTANLTNVTIANNYAASPSSSAGITSGTGFATWNIKNSIIANNLNSNGNADFYINSLNHQLNISYSLVESIWNPTSGTQSHPVTSANGNLPNVDPWLDGRLLNYGGNTKTLALRRGSPAIDSGDPTTFPSTDQRGIARPQGARADMGAFERRAVETNSTDKADLDGDGKTDLSIFRPNGAASEWWWNRSSDGSNPAVVFGASTDTLVPSDYTGDGKSDIAFWRSANGHWFVLRSENLTFYSAPFGSSGDIPAPADYDGDSKSDIAVFRPSNSVWYIFRSSDGSVTTTPFGIAEDKPVVADYDGDGKDDIAVFRPSLSQWWFTRSSNNSFGAAQFGQPGDRTVQGDYSGDAKADIAVWRPSTGVWYIMRSEDSSFYAFPFGTMGDIPTQGDFDGDGKTDPSIFRPGAGVWYLNQSTAGMAIRPFGQSADVPLPSVFNR